MLNDAAELKSSRPIRALEAGEEGSVWAEEGRGSGPSAVEPVPTFRGVWAPQAPATGGRKGPAALLPCNGARIDFEPFDAFTQGVSRLHAQIKLEKGKITIKDLGSQNGTRINKKRIIPYKECRLRDGDLLQLGQIDIQLLVMSVDG